MDRFCRLFARYAEARLTLERTGPVLADGTQVARLRYRSGRLEVTGRTRCDRLVLRDCGVEQAATLGPPGADGTRPFSIELPFAVGPITLVGARAQTLPTFTPFRLARARVALMPRFAFALALALPDLTRARWHRDAEARERARIRLGLSDGPLAPRIAARDLARAETPLPCALRSAAAVGTPPLAVFVAHRMGGGAEADLRRRLRTEIADRNAAIVLRVGAFTDWDIEVHRADGITRAAVEDEATVQRLMAMIPDRRIVYGCAVGAPDPLGVPGLVRDLAAGRDLEVLLHDYFVVSPSYTLLGRDGRYHGLPRPGTATGGDPAHRAWRPDGCDVALEDWQAAWGALLRAAQRITAFSPVSAALVGRAYPDISARIMIAPHALHSPVARLAPPPAQRVPVIGVLGHIGPHKGAAVLADLGAELARTGAARLVVIGTVEPALPPRQGVTVHGPYRLDDLPLLAARHGICGWFIPSIWPETFSFTTHEALATGLPTVTFDLGAQAEAVTKAAAGGAAAGTLPLSLTEAPRALAEGLVGLIARPRSPHV